MNILRSVLLLSWIYLTIVKGEDQPPRITEHPADILARRNEPVTLGCHAEGHPEPVLRWYKDGRPLDPEVRHRVVLPAGGLFFLHIVHGKKESDGGVYWCEATNRAGSVRSRNATLSVAVLRDEFKLEPRDTATTRGQTVIFECDPPKGHPEPSLHWCKDGDVIDFQPSSRLRLVDGTNLMISDVRSSDAGNYQCVVQNVVGLRESRPALLDVHVKPFFLVTPRDTTVSINETARLTCHVGGDPTPTVRWFQQSPVGSRPASLPANATVTEDHTLALQLTTVTDQGVYVCQASNTVGSVSSSATVTVLAPPKFLARPYDQNVHPGDLALFPCKAEGYPPPQVFWNVEGTQDLMYSGYSIEDYRVAEDNTLSVRAAIGHSATFVCSAVNEAGANVVRASLQISTDDIIPAPPSESTNHSLSSPGRPQVLNVTQDSVSLTWFPAHPSTPSTVYSVLYYNLDMKGEWMTAASGIPSTNVLITDLRPATFYVFSVFAEDSDDVSEPSVTSDTVQTLNSNARKVTLGQLNSARSLLSDTVLQLKQLSAVSSTAVRVVWQILRAEAYVEGIYLHYQPLTETGSDWKAEYRLVTVLNAGATSYTVTGLWKYTQYRVFLVPFYKTVEGRPSNSRMVQTLEDVPSAAPTNLEVGWLNETTTFVHWSTPPLNKLNGNLIGYKLQVKASGRVLATFSVNASTSSMTLHNANPHMYVRVSAMTLRGTGPYSPEVLIGPQLSPPAARPTDHGSSKTLLTLTLAASVIVCSLAFLTSFYIKRRQALKKELGHCVNNIGDLSQMSLVNACKDTLWVEGGWVGLQAFKHPPTSSAVTYSTPSLSTFYTARKENTTPYATANIVHDAVSKSQIIPIRAVTSSELRVHSSNERWPKTSETKVSHSSTLPNNANKSQFLISASSTFATKSTSEMNERNNRAVSQRRSSLCGTNYMPAQEGTTNCSTLRLPASEYLPSQMPSVCSHTSTKSSRKQLDSISRRTDEAHWKLGL